MAASLSSSLAFLGELGQNPKVLVSTLEHIKTTFG